MNGRASRDETSAPYAEGSAFVLAPCPPLRPSSNRAGDDLGELLQQAKPR